MKKMIFEVAGGLANRDGEPFHFRIENEDALKMLAGSHHHVNKVVRGALCKQFVEKLGLFLGRETTLEEAYVFCRRIG
tara:strand:- start:38 stop:271 length:234 start_codon:yes stop_codon:yes gene_type:complete